MIIEYDDKKLKELFDDLNDVKRSARLLQKEIGLELTKSIKKRYNEIQAFDNFLDLVMSKLGNIESLSGDRKGLYSMTLSKNYRLIFKPHTNDLSPESLRLCDTLIIKEVTDYHGKGKNNRLIP